jgi:hypothetical protein
MYLYTKECIDTLKFRKTFNIYLWSEIVYDIVIFIIIILWYVCQDILHGKK